MFGMDPGGVVVFVLILAVVICIVWLNRSSRKSSSK